MIRPDMVSLASQMVSDASSNLQIGIIDFPGGNSTVDKLFEAKKAIQDGADDWIMFVITRRFKMAI
jgi:deoxyribose-phosphate aldolase